MSEHLAMLPDALGVNYPCLALHYLTKQINKLNTTRFISNIHRFFSEDFVILFSFYDDMLRVLHDPASSVAPFLLCSKRWRQKGLASAESLLYQVIVAICGLPTHVWSLAATR
jgi:hypothetical protein